MNIKEYPKVDDVRNGEVFLLDGPRGTKTIPADKFEFAGSGAGYANSIVNEYSLGDHLTSEQSEDIRSGTFKLVRVGGYWTINGRKYWAAHADYRFSLGSPSLLEHHMLVVTDDSIYTSPMNASATNKGGYVGSEMFTKHLNNAKSIVEKDFGTSHILPYSLLLPNAVTNGEESGWVNCTNLTVDLLSEVMLTGNNSNRRSHVCSDNTQVALFKARRDLITNSVSYWLRDANTGLGFAFNIVQSNGSLSETSSTVSLGVRPAFLVY